MGPQWEEWMALREWVSNSLDEGQSNIVTETDTVSGRDGYTRFFIEHSPGIRKVIDEWNLYFTFDREDMQYENPLGRLYHQSNIDERMILFRKGIRVYDAAGTQSLYHYDLNGFEINESRIITSLYDGGYKMLEFLNTVDDVKVLRNVLQNATKGSYFESRLSWKWGISKLSEHWKTAIGNHVLIVEDVSGYFQEAMMSKPYYIVTSEMAAQFKRSFPDITVYGVNGEGEQLVYKSVEATKKIEFLLKESLSFLKETEYSIDNEIEIVDFERTEILGLAESGKILLASKLFDLGKKEIVRTIIEEQEHLRTGLKDCTRSFQNHLFNMVVSEMENKTGHFL
jgi:hypothetical protein